MSFLTLPNIAQSSLVCSFIQATMSGEHCHFGKNLTQITAFPSHFRLKGCI